MGKFKEKWKAFDNKVGRYGETVKCGIYAVIGFGMFLIGGVIVRSIIPFVGFPPVVLIGFISSVIALIGFLASIINGFLFLWNGIKDLFSLPGKAMQKARIEKVQKEREQAEAKLQAKIDAESAPYKVMADNGDTTAIKEIAKVYYKNGKENEARNLYESAAGKGDVDAQLTLAKSYKIIGNEVSAKWASCVEENPNASDAEKESARSQKQAIAEYEQYLGKKQEEERERQRQAREQQRREEEAYQAWKQKEMQTPVTGDYFRPYSGGVTCANKGASCRYCARRRWYPGGWGDDDCRIGM